MNNKEEQLVLLQQFADCISSIIQLQEMKAEFTLSYLTAENDEKREEVLRTRKIKLDAFIRENKDKGYLPIEEKKKEVREEGYFDGT